MDTAAKRYAAALFELAKEEKTVEDYKLELIELVNSISSDVKTFMESHFIDQKAKKEFLNKAYKKNISPMLFNFINLINDKSRFNCLDEIKDEYILLANNYLGIEEGLIYTVSKLSESVLNSLEEKISKITGKKVILKQVIDPSIIGGFKIIINDTVYDNSIKNKLDELKLNLKKKEVN